MSSLCQKNWTESRLYSKSVDIYNLDLWNFFVRQIGIDVFTFPSSKRVKSVRHRCVFQSYISRSRCHLIRIATSEDLKKAAGVIGMNTVIGSNRLFPVVTSRKIAKETGRSKVFSSHLQSNGSLNCFRLPSSKDQSRNTYPKRHFLFLL